LRLCQTRLRKLFGREGALPPPPEIDTSAWHYWRTEHRSRSQNGNPMFLNGCVGPLYLMGETLAAWRPWIALFSAIGLGERLSFGQGRFSPSGCEGARTQHRKTLPRPCASEGLSFSTHNMSARAFRSRTITSLSSGKTTPSGDCRFSGFRASQFLLLALSPVHF